MAGILDKLGLEGIYKPHAGKPYDNMETTPGTVDPEIPTLVQQDDMPDTAHLLERAMEHTGMDHLLDQLFAMFHQPDYEYAGPYTAGGKSQASLSQVANATGVGSVYTLPNPYDNDAEYAVIQAVFGAAGQAILSRDPNNLGPALTAFYDGPSLVRGMPFFAAGVGTFPVGQENWFPISASDSLFWSVNMATANTDSALITVMFRRRINRHGKFYLTIE